MTSIPPPPSEAKASIESKDQARQISREILKDPVNGLVFAGGTVVGVAADMLSSGLSLGQGTVGGGALAITLKLGAERLFMKRALKRRCNALAELHERRGDKKKSQRFRELAKDISQIKNLNIEDISEELEFIKGS